ncbi:MAG: hypothetical protein ACLPVW_16835, partial [Terriglobales bacterium]
HIQLLLVFSTHAFFLSGCAVETRVFRGAASASNRVFPQPARALLFGKRDRNTNGRVLPLDSDTVRDLTRNPLE